MRVCERFVRALILTSGMCCLMAGYASGQAAPAVTVSPSSLTFGVPGTVSAPSASQQVNISVTGGSVPVSISFSGNANNSFTENDTCGTNPAKSTPVAPPGCVINVTYTPHPQPNQPKLETATLNVSALGSFSVNLSGALGAIQLFKSVTTGPSNGGATLQNMVTFNSTTLALSCPASSSATLSSSPDGLGNVLVDNFITVRPGANLQPQTTLGQIAGSNVCPANLGNPADSGQADCFTSDYQGPAGRGQLNGVDPDTITNSGNTNPFLNGAAGGVPPIPLSGFTANMATTPTTTISMLDGGGFVASSSLFLVTQCVPNGVAPGGTVTGNPVDPNIPATLTQSFPFDTVNGQGIQFTSNIANAPDVAPAGTQQVTQDFPIPQALFFQLVKGTAAAPAVCVRLNSEKDSSGNPMCKGFLVQCWDPHHSTLSGDNCTPNPSAARNLFDFTGYDSDDAPPGQNYLGVVGSNNTTKSACRGVATNCAQSVIGTDAPSTMLVGPGLLMGGDQWLCPPNSDLTMCQNQVNRSTSDSPGTTFYTKANCVLTGSLKDDPCPLNPLTQFKGASDPVHGSTTTGKNSLFIPVVNMPLPFTQTTVAGRNSAGWVQTPGPTATFTSNQANYVPQSGNPAGNTFVPTPPYSVTYGLAKATDPALDTTFPVPGDQVAYNDPNVTHGFGTPLCSITTPPPSSFTTTSAPFTAAVAKGIYNLHYFTTDCALSEELLFQPTTVQQSDATANWASFHTIAFGVDNGLPTLTCPTPNPTAAHGWFLTLPSVSCSATDDYSGFGPGSPVADPACTSPVAGDCNVMMGLPTASPTAAATGLGAAAQIAPQTIADLAGNMSTPTAAILTPVDNTAPILVSATFSVSGTNFSVGQNVTAKFSCTDDTSGLAICGNQPLTTCSAAPTPNLLTSVNTTGIPIDTSAAAVGSHTLNAVDCAGNVSAKSVTYTVAFGSSELAIATLPNPLASVKSGSNLTYKTFVLNLGPNAASNVVVTNTLPANTTYVSAISGIVSCTLAGCNDLTTGSMCTNSGNTVICTTPTVKPILPGLTGFVIKLVVKVTAPASVKSITDTATVSSSNPDPIKGDNTATVTTKVTQ